MTPEKILAALDHRAAPRLQPWLAAHRVQVAGLVGGVAGSAQTRKLLALIDNIKARLESATEKHPGIVDAWAVKSAAYDQKAIEAAAEALRAQGWNVKVQAAYAGTQLVIYPEAPLVEALARKAAETLAGVRWMPPVPAVTAQAHPAPGRVFFVGDETWWLAMKGSADAANRFAGRPRLPEGTKFIAPPPWAEALVKAQRWARYRDFETFGGRSACEVAGRFAAKEDTRYGLNGVGWANNFICGTDGNRLHGVEVPEYAPPGAGVLWPRHMWTEPFYGSSFGGLDSFVTPRFAGKGQAFPDVFQVVPSESHFGWRVHFTVPELKKLRALANKLGAQGRVLAYPNGTFFGFKADEPLKKPEAGAVPVGTLGEVNTSKYRPSRVLVQARFLKEALDPFIEAGQPAVWSFAPHEMQPTVIRQPGIQFHVIMPMRID